jgi:hypothetical protein
LSCILDLRFACLELFQQHDDALEHIDRFETGDNDRLPFVPRDPLLRAHPMMVGTVARPDERVDAHVRRIEDGANAGNDRHMIAGNGQIMVPWPLPHQPKAVEGAVVSNPIAKKITSRPDCSARASTHNREPARHQRYIKISTM